MSENKISLKLLEAYTRDVGRCIARIDYDTMDMLSASTGDVIEIKGMRRTVAKCLPLYPSDEGKGIIRIDGLSRNNSGTTIEDSISVKKIKAVAAEIIIVAPLEAMPPIDERYLASALESVPLIKGDNVMVPYFGGRLTFQIIGVTPNADAVLVTQKTVFTIAEKAEMLSAKKETECPSCETDVELLDEHCRKCGHQLDAFTTTQLLEEWVSAVESNDVNQVVDLYRDDGLFFGEGRKGMIGHEQIRAIFGSSPEYPGEMGISTWSLNKELDCYGRDSGAFFHTTQKITILSQNPRVFGSVAVNSGRYVLTIVFMKDSHTEFQSFKEIEIEAWFSFVYNKDDDGVWKIVSHHHSTHPRESMEKSNE